MLFRVFPYRPATEPRDPGGALFVPRHVQGYGRHDNPQAYGAMYAARSPESAVAERLQFLPGRSLSGADLRRGGLALALATIDDSALSPMPDLDDPRELSRRRLRPSTVATRRRALTRPMALEIFEDGQAGFAWWSTIEASWANLTLFAERAGPSLQLLEEPVPLSTGHPSVREAAAALGVRVDA